ncbi:MAG: hypothetical protein FJZ58_01320 [Chlamydiae bacterium]|nr:hypothetical protein [Chlamydiota bacterium]
MEKGILVASDARSEWLLPWWWERYRACNTYPVAFVDLGMGVASRLWCEERGYVLQGEKSSPQEPVEERLASWEKIYGKSYKQVRQAWFQKPLACLISPFETTVWLDLDCEVLSSIQELFSYVEEKKELAVCREISSYTYCNSGVIVFKKKCSLLQKWADLCVYSAASYWGDDHALSEVVLAHRERCGELPFIYNWRISQGIPLQAKIIHWCGEWGKAYIAKRGGLKADLVAYPLMKELYLRDFPI